MTKELNNVLDNINIRNIEILIHALALIRDNGFELDVCEISDIALENYFELDDNDNSYMNKLRLENKNLKKMVTKFEKEIVNLNNLINSLTSFLE